MLINMTAYYISLGAIFIGLIALWFDVNKTETSAKELLEEMNEFEKVVNEWDKKVWEIYGR